MVSVSVSKLDCLGLVFVDLAVKFNGSYYHDELLIKRSIEVLQFVPQHTCTLCLWHIKLNTQWTRSTHKHTYCQQVRAGHTRLLLCKLHFKSNILQSHYLHILQWGRS